MNPADHSNPPLDPSSIGDSTSKTNSTIVPGSQVVRPHATGSLLSSPADTLSGGGARPHATGVRHSSETPPSSLAPGLLPSHTIVGSQDAPGRPFLAPNYSATQTTFHTPNVPTASSHHVAPAIYVPTPNVPTSAGLQPNIPTSGFSPNFPLAGFSQNLMPGPTPNFPMGGYMFHPMYPSLVQHQSSGAPAMQSSQVPVAPAPQEPRSAPNFELPLSAPDSVVSSELGSDDDGVDDRTPTRFSFGEAVSMLLQSFPDMAAAETETDDSNLSMAAIALGMGSSGNRNPRLKETSCVSSALTKALLAVRGSKGKGGVSADNVPKFPSALPCGSFLPYEKTPFSRSLLEKHSIPDGPMHASPEDLSLIPESAKSDKRPVSFTDKAAADLEESARRSLETISILDSFLTGFIMSVRHPDSPALEFQIREEMDTECLGAFAAASVSLMQFLADSMAKLHTNIRLARKDALLNASSHSKDVRASLRAAPPDPEGSFFGSCASSSIEHEAKLRRDLHYMQPLPKQSKPQSAPRGARRGSFGSSSGRQHSFASTRPKPKPQSDRYQPYPSQSSSQGSSKRKGDKRRPSHKGGHPQ